MKTLAGTTTTAAIAVSVCPRCGTIGKSGKSSCCGRGGSWFRNCGGGGNTRLQHTWYEGIQACKARSQSKTIIGHQLNGAQRKDIDPSQGSDMVNDKTVLAVTKMFELTSVNISTLTSDTTSIVTSIYTSDHVSITIPYHTLVANTLTDTFVTSSTHTSVSMSITTLGYVNLFKMTVHINLLFTIIF